ncbi:aminopeptidase P family protein [bacterium]|nr:aminopeptidase P family protein [bacterium]
MADTKPDPSFPPREYSRRLARLEKQVAKSGADALVVLTPVNRLYLTGFQSTNGLLLIEPGREVIFYTDFRYFEMARREIGFLKRAVLKDLPGALKQLGRKRKWKKVGYEGSITALQLGLLRAALPDVDWIESEGPIRDLRAVKSSREQAALRRAVRLGDRVYEETLEQVRPGMTEWEIRRILRRRIDDLDAQGESFDCIVSVGSSASRPHAHVSRRVLRPRQLLLIDMGIRLNHYCSDLTRTVFYGQPSPRMREVYDVVLHAQLHALDAVRAGRTCKEIDGIARGTIEKAGYGKRFGHNLGHGVGLEIHEDPALAPKSEIVLQPGMVITIEPGIYLPGIGGVRIEDMVIVRNDGCEILTGTQKSLRAL